jgi:hypothetical protein
MRGCLFTSCYPRLRSGAGRTPFPIFHSKRDTTELSGKKPSGKKPSGKKPSGKSGIIRVFDTKTRQRGYEKL